MFKIFQIATVMILGLNIASAAVGPTDELEDVNDNYSYDYSEISNRCAIYDPYQKLNRHINKFNYALDRAIFTPLGKTYGIVTNDYIRGRFNSFFLNIHEPITAVNYAAQRDSKNFLSSLWRFTINSTFGILGIFDVASKFGLSPEPQTFSGTLAFYGLGSGPYIEIPVLGGYNARDIIDVVSFEFMLNPFVYANTSVRLTEASVRTAHYRQKAFPFTDHVYKDSLDPYISIRDALVNSRESKVTYPKGYVCPQLKK